MNKKILMIALLIPAVLGSTAIAFTIVSNKIIVRSPLPTHGASLPQVQDDAPRRFLDANRVRASALSSDLRALLTACGDRLEKLGKERVTYMGMLQRAVKVSETDR